MKLQEKDIEKYKRIYFANDMPVPFKTRSGYELKIYPVKVKDWSIFEISLGIFLIDKNASGNAEIIQMSYLDYLVLLLSRDKTSDCALYIANVFFYAMQEEHIYLGKKNNRNVIVITDEHGNVKGYVTSREIEHIIKIIQYQNIYDFNDDYIDPDVKALAEDYYRIKNKDGKSPSFEEKKTYTIAKTGMGLADINEMSYRMFSQVYNHCVGDVLYIGSKIIQGSYKYKVDEDIRHPLFEKPKDIYAELFTDTSTLKEKGISGAERLDTLNVDTL